MLGYPSQMVVLERWQNQAPIFSPQGVPVKPTLRLAARRFGIIACRVRGLHLLGVAGRCLAPLYG
ncbi:MAG: hypothetical protein A3J25_10920 [Pseudomonadales bacterium RIFCSPLOWO2_02_FULL_63_210]|nr:MAG: hypothetical protein A3J25_10920 [Pseudomonadales bacterium RIFCSPLOWO2_02_FULL_63_210]